MNRTIKDYDFIKFLLQKHDTGETKKGKIKFDWEGELSNPKTEYTSVELQHKALE